LRFGDGFILWIDVQARSLTLLVVMVRRKGTVIYVISVGAMLLVGHMLLVGLYLAGYLHLVKEGYLENREY